MKVWQQPEALTRLNILNRLIKDIGTVVPVMKGRSFCSVKVVSRGYGLILGCKMNKKYYLVRTRGGHIRHVGLTTGDLSSQGPL